MVTANGTRRKKAKAKVETEDKPLTPRMKKILIIGFSIPVAFAILNALLDTNDYQSRPMLDTSHEIPSVKPTSLITQLDNVTEEDNIMKVEFSAINTNATYQVKKFECAIDMNPWYTCTSPVTINLNAYANTNHTLEIRVFDNHDGMEEQPLAHIFDLNE